MSMNKVWLQLLATVLAAVAPAFVENNWYDQDLTHWINVLILVVGAYQVWNATNSNIWPKGKMFASAAMSVLVLLVSFVDGGVNTGEIIQLVLAALAPFGVYAVANRTIAT